MAQKCSGARVWCKDKHALLEQGKFQLSGIQVFDLMQMLETDRQAMVSAVKSVEI